MVFDNASTDGSRDYLASVADSRLTILQSLAKNVDGVYDVYRVTSA